MTESNVIFLEHFKNKNSLKNKNSPKNKNIKFKNEKVDLNEITSNAVASLLMSLEEDGIDTENLENSDFVSYIYDVVFNYLYNIKHCSK